MSALLFNATVEKSEQSGFSPRPSQKFGEVS